MAEGFIGEIRLFAGNFAPRGWALCNGQLLSIAQNTALFSILGTTYGGNGQTTFALPDLRGRVPLHPGTGPGLADRFLGESAGQETHTLLQSEMPAHGHQLNATANTATATSPAGGVLAQPARPAYAAGGAASPMSASSLGNAGGSQPHNNMAPYLGLNFIICMEGIFPPRN